VSEGLDEDALFAVALMRIALELKKTPPAGFEASVREVVARMRLNEIRFRAFLSKHLAEVGAAAPAKGSARRRRTPRD
jgi:hypothetical protein